MHIVAKNLTPSPTFQAKLHRLLMRVEVIQWPQLGEFLTEGRQRPLTPISVAAGYGKTTLGNRWLETPEGLGTWLSLEEHDHHLSVLLPYLVTAVRRLSRQFCPWTLFLLGAAELPPWSVLVTHLINDSDATDLSFVLVSDDEHRINAPLVHEALSRLLQHHSRPYPW